ncbi:MAG TPA: HAD hydrolase-like protein [Xanthobacteraceae bacterium]|nr:HAD hydrolase-like protein [Xanthobacteraceae bacterium]
MKYRLVIFDMDGTLADSFPWFMTVMNSVADKFRFRRIAPDEVETLRRLDSQRILERLDVPRWKLPLIARHMRALKAQHIADIALFPGVDGMLHELKSRGLRIGVVSSDSEANVRRALRGENARRIDDYACGASLFGKQAKFRRVLTRSGVAAHDAIAIGDELRDAQAARDLGIAFGAVAWGYTHVEALQDAKPDHVFLAMNDIVTQLT